MSHLNTMYDWCVYNRVAVDGRIHKDYVFKARCHRWRGGGGCGVQGTTADKGFQQTRQPTAYCSFFFSFSSVFFPLVFLRRPFLPFGARGPRGPERRREKSPGRRFKTALALSARLRRQTRYSTNARTKGTHATMHGVIGRVCTTRAEVASSVIGRMTMTPTQRCWTVAHVRVDASRPFSDGRQTNRTSVVPDGAAARQIATTARKTSAWRRGVCASGGYRCLRRTRGYRTRCESRSHVVPKTGARETKRRRSFESLSFPIVYESLLRSE